MVRDILKKKTEGRPSPDLKVKLFQELGRGAPKAFAWKGLVGAMAACLVIAVAIYSFPRSNSISSRDLAIFDQALESYLESEEGLDELTSWEEDSLLAGADFQELDFFDGE